MPIVRRYQDSSLRKHFLTAGAFVCPEVYQYLEQEGFGYAIRLPDNPVLQRQLETLVTRPVDWGPGGTVSAIAPELSYLFNSGQNLRQKSSNLGLCQLNHPQHE